MCSRWPTEHGSQCIAFTVGSRRRPPGQHHYATSDCLQCIHGVGMGLTQLHGSQPVCADGLQHISHLSGLPQCHHRLQGPCMALLCPAAWHYGAEGHWAWPAASEREPTRRKHAVWCPVARCAAGQGSHLNSACCPLRLDDRQTSLH